MKAQITTFDKSQISPEQVCFVYNNDRLLMVDGRLPIRSELELSLDSQEAVFKTKNGWVIPGDSYAKKNAPGLLEFHRLRDVIDSMATPVARDAALAAQLINWSIGSRFCGACGKKNKVVDESHKNAGDVAKFCAECDRTTYPTLTPVVIVLVRRGHEVLLARGHSPRKSFSCLAGFTEPGETLEEAIRREVKEEVGVEVRNLRYFGSQPWPFPNNLMVGFTADWIAGDIKIDEKELSEAQWFTRDQLTEKEIGLPLRTSIARQMIEAFKKG